MKALQVFDYDNICWWCFGPADSSEHKFKRTDIVSEFGRPPYRGNSSMIRYVGDELIATNIQGPNSNHFKFKSGLCKFCNTTKSRPFDLAYESFIKYTNLNKKTIVLDLEFDFTKVFGLDWSSSIDNVRRYFLKHACCRIADAGFRIGDELLSFLDGKVPNVPFYLTAEIRSDIHERFCQEDNRFGSLWLGDLIGWHAPENSRLIRIQSFYGIGCLRFSWIYDTLARNWPDNMRNQIVPLSQGRNLDPPQEDKTG